MKVLHLISGGDTGGAKTHVHSLLLGLKEHIDVSMVCFIEAPFVEEARALGINVQVISGNFFRALRLLERKVREEGFELLHCHGGRGNLMGCFLKLRTGLPTVSTVHSDYRLDYLGRPLARMTYGPINAVALRQMDYRIGVSQAMVDTLIDRGFPPDRFFRINNGLPFPPPPASRTRAEFFASCGLEAGEGDVVVGIAARLNPVKDIPTLLRGFAKAREGHPELRLLIAGDGEQRAELEALASRLGLGSAVCFAGWQSDMNSFCSAIDINALTSVSEGFPYSIVEGARACLPTVSTRVGGIPTLITHGETGLLFEPGDVDALARHLSQLAADPALRERLGRELYRRAEGEFSLTEMVRRQVEIYETIFRREGRPKQKRDGVTICGAYGRGNAGDDAILEAIITEMRQMDPDIPVRVLSRNPRLTRRTYRVDTVYTFNVPGFRRFMRRSRLYVNGGGSLMQDVTSRRSLWFYLYSIYSAKRLGCRVMMYGCGIGPIHYPDNRRLASWVMDRCADVITLRDRFSMDELSDMNVAAPEIVLAADPTVILPAAPRAAADGILEANGLPAEGRFISFSVRPWPGYERRAHIFGAAADYAYEKYGLIPLFLPIEDQVDSAAAQQAARSIRHAPYRILGACSSSALTISLFSRMDVVVSMRLHALVFAAGHGVPLVGVVYDQKVSSFLESVGQDLYTDLESLTEENLCALIDAAVARRGDQDYLSAGVERLRRAESRNSEYARRLLEL